MRLALAVPLPLVQVVMAVLVVIQHLLEQLLPVAEVLVVQDRIKGHNITEQETVVVVLSNPLQVAVVVAVQLTLSIGYRI
jgi:hypothetical protein